MPFILPKHNHRTSIMGRTGTGKTVMGAFILAHSNFHEKPYYIVDVKGEDLFDYTDRIKEIGLNETPNKPGIYRVRPLMPAQQDQLEAWLWRVYNNENTGLFFDEAYMIPDDGAFPAILTQGRSKNINCLICTQRPAWISRFVFSEAHQFCVFHLNDKDDRTKVKRFLPPNTPIHKRLPPHHSLWYDVSNDRLTPLSPVPDGKTIMDKIHDRLKPKRWYL